MSINTENHPAGFQTFTLEAADNRLVISAFGGQIISWTKAGTPIIFENADRAIVDGKTPYRGGAPICFPYFSKGNLLPLGITLNPQHGHARTTIWDAQINELENSVTLTTTQPTPEGYGPSEFLGEITYKLSEVLEIEATVRNLGPNSAPFQLAIHSYWATKLPEQARVSGLGMRYLDNLLNLSEHKDPSPDTPHPSPVDRVYLEAEQAHRIQTESYTLEISTTGCSGVVLWNPGKDHTLKDLGSPDFVCIECGQISPSQSLSPGESSQMKVTLHATTLSESAKREP